MTNIREQLRDFGRAMVANSEVKGAKLIIYFRDGTYVEYNSLFDKTLKGHKRERRLEK